MVATMIGKRHTPVKGVRPPASGIKVKNPKYGVKIQVTGKFEDSENRATPCFANVNHG